MWLFTNKELIFINRPAAGPKAALPEATIYVYDNNSTDRTVELARAAGAVIRHDIAEYSKTRQEKLRA